MDNYLQQLETFSLDTLPDLDTAVLGALQLFETASLPRIDIQAYKRPLVVGSGNAEATGRIIFDNTDAVFASESDFAAKLATIPAIDGVVIVSASGGKHAPIIAQKARELGKPVTLITNTKDSLASRELDGQHAHDQFVFPKNREPYTYNTSTYLGMILGHTSEDPASIFKFIEERVASISFPDFSKCNKYYLIVPPEFSGIIRMLQVKFIELFGRNIARDIETSEYVRHATTVAPSDELFISFGGPNTTWGAPDRRLDIPLPDNANYGAMMAVGYYVIAQIQKAQPPYFKDNIAAYTAMISDIFHELITPVVEA